MKEIAPGELIVVRDPSRPQNGQVFELVINSSNELTDALPVDLIFKGKIMSDGFSVE